MAHPLPHCRYDGALLDSLGPLQLQTRLQAFLLHQGEGTVLDGVNGVLAARHTAHGRARKSHVACCLFVKAVEPQPGWERLGGSLPPNLALRLRGDRWRRLQAHFGGAGADRACGIRRGADGLVALVLWSSAALH